MAINSSSTKKELVDYLRDVHGIDMPAESTKDALLAKAAELDGVPYENMTAPAPARSSEAVEIAKQGKKRIVIASTEGVEGQHPVFVGVNGVSFLIQRDVEVDVPESVVGVLRDAKTTTYRMIENNMVPREIPTYPFSIVG